jgi:hypothetical protein
MKLKTLRMALLASVVAVLALASPTYAGVATDGGYQSVAGDVQTQVTPAINGNDPDDRGNGPEAARTTRTSDGSELPFTGLDAALVALLGMGLVGLGLGLRTLVRRQATSA